MIDLPPGEWSALLVGEHWPGPSAPVAMSEAADRRANQAATLEQYAEQLRSAREAHLAPQSGIAAETLRGLFDRGRRAVLDVADRNRVKADAYRRARHSVDQLRTDLAEIAADGNAAIEAVNRSDAPVDRKVAAILEVITAARTAAATKVAGHTDTVYAAVQSVLDSQGLDGSARMFAAAQGVSPDLHRGSPAIEALRREVTGRVADHDRAVTEQ